MTVHLVGAGPGDPELLTMRAASLLRRADVLVHDRLVGERVLDLAPPWAERVNVGKAPGRQGVSQERIHAILLDRSRCFECVVRLKGGDPFVFGRGGEEAEALRAAGVDIEIVPGVSSALAAPAAAGIPVTMRGQSSGFTVVTAHQDPTADTRLDWDCLARSGATLVILMGAAQAARIADRLCAAGMASSTPTTVVRSATTDCQHVDRTTLEGLSSLEVVSPSVIVVGAVAARDVLAVPGVGAVELLGRYPEAASSVQEAVSNGDSDAQATFLDGSAGSSCVQEAVSNGDSQVLKEDSHTLDDDSQELDDNSQELEDPALCKGLSLEAAMP